MSKLEKIKLYQTTPHECSYLTGKLASTLFVDPSLKITPEILTNLSEQGFRRSGNYTYLPNCDECSACISTRIPVSQFKPNRNQKRVWKRNQDLTWSISAPRFTDEFYDLYQRYIEVRHADGDMYPASEDQFRSFLIESYADSIFLEFRLSDKLLAVAVTDKLNNAYSAVYTFFEPELPQRSLGVFTILAQLEQAEREKLDYLYLGYWVKACQKMSYKINYRPLEILLHRHWTLLS